VHECGDIVVRMRAEVGPETVRLDPRTADVHYETRLRELSAPLFAAAGLFAACDVGTLVLITRTTNKLPEGSLLTFLIPLSALIVGALGLFDPSARRVRVRGASRTGQRIATELTFPTTKSARTFAAEAVLAKESALADEDASAELLSHRS
jgi:hypothetical protein